MIAIEERRFLFRLMVLFSLFVFLGCAANTAGTYGTAGSSSRSSSSGSSRTSSTNVEALILQQRYKEAKALCADSRGENRSYCYLSLANAYYAAGDLENAAFCFGAVEGNPAYAKRSKEIYGQLAKARFDKGDLSGAAAMYQRAGDNPGVKRVADAYFAKNQYEMAAKYYQAINYSKGTQQVADAYLSKGDLEKAAKHYTDLKSKNGLRRVADAHLAKGELKEAAKLYTDLKSKEGLRRVADVYLSKGQPLSAAKLYQAIGDKAALGRVAESFFDQKKYDQAAHYFQLAGNANPYPRIAEACLADKNYDLAKKYMLLAGTQTVFDESFDTDRNGWVRDRGDRFKQSVADGRMVVDHRHAGNRWVVTPGLPAAVNPADNFTLEARIQKLGGAKEAHYALVWGLKDPGNYFALEIDEAGAFTYGRVTSGRWAPIVDWTEAPGVVLPGDLNTLAVLKEGNSLKFMANGRLLGQSAFEKGDGNQVGVGGSKRIQVAVDSMQLKRVPAEREINLKIAEISATNRDYDVAARYLQAAGYKKNDAYLEIATASHKLGDLAATEHYLQLYGFSQRDAYLRIAEQSLGYGDVKTAAIYIEKSGWPLQKIEAEPVLVDDFTDNRLNWFEGEDAESLRLIYDGKYFFEQKRKQGAWFTWPRNPVLLDQRKDFIVEADITKLDGVDDNSYDLFWGFQDMQNLYSFGINGDGYYRFVKIAEGQMKTIINWTPSQNIAKHNASNTLSIVKEGGTLRFFINDHLVNSAPAEPFFGSKVGFMVNDNISLAIDRIRVLHTPPVDIVPLAAAVYERVGDLNGLKMIGDIYDAKKDPMMAAKFYRMANYTPTGSKN